MQSHDNGIWPTTIVVFCTDVPRPFFGKCNGLTSKNMSLKGHCACCIADKCLYLPY